MLQVILIMVLTDTVHIRKDMLVLIYITVMLIGTDTIHIIKRILAINCIESDDDRSRRYQERYACFNLCYCYVGDNRLCSYHK